MRVAVTMICVVLAGCGLPQRVAQKFERPPGFVPPERPPDSCHSETWREYVGQPSGVLNDIFLPPETRIIPRGSAVTQDYSPTRANFDLDDDGNIERIWCG